MEDLKMSVKYNVIERHNPGNPTAPKKHYPSVVSSGRKNLRQISKTIANISTLSSTDVMAAIEAFLNVIPEELADGNIVELGDFGNFWLRINTEGTATAEEVSTAQITRVLPRFSPGKEFKKVLQEVDFKKA